MILTREALQELWQEKSGEGLEQLIMEKSTGEVGR